MINLKGIITMNKKNTMEDIKIREATESDTALILDFIKGLAEYEKLSHEVMATEETLKDSIFKRKMAEVIICEYKEKPVGFCLFFHNFSTFLGKPGIYIEDLFILKEYRNLGLGKIMFTHIARLTKERDCGRLEWWVLDWNEPSIQFYKKLGAKPMDDWTVFRLDGEALDNLVD